jgi:DNA-binding response OmpR family regulator
VIVIDQLFLLRFTPIEYRLFSLLLSRAGALVTEEELTEAAVQSRGKNNASDTHLMSSIERHIGALRVKLQNTGLSVLRVVGVGWILTSDKSQE